MQKPGCTFERLITCDSESCQLRRRWTLSLQLCDSGCYANFTAVLYCSRDTRLPIPGCNMLHHRNTVRNSCSHVALSLSHHAKSGHWFCGVQKEVNRRMRSGRDAVLRLHNQRSACVVPGPSDSGGGCLPSQRNLLSAKRHRVGLACHAPHDDAESNSALSLFLQKQCLSNLLLVKLIRWGFAPPS